MRPIVFDCPERNVTVISDVLCAEGALQTLVGHRISVGCPVCRGVHWVNVRVPKRFVAAAASA
jgi:hypothetical protein